MKIYLFAMKTIHWCLTGHYVWRSCHLIFCSVANIQANSKRTEVNRILYTYFLSERQVHNVFLASCLYYNFFLHYHFVSLNSCVFHQILWNLVFLTWIILCFFVIYVVSFFNSILYSLNYDSSKTVRLLASMKTIFLPWTLKIQLICSVLN